MYLNSVVLSTNVISEMSLNNAALSTKVIPDIVSKFIVIII